MLGFGVCLEGALQDPPTAVECVGGVALAAITNNVAASLVIAGCVVATLVLCRSWAVSAAVLLAALLIVEPIAAASAPWHARVLVAMAALALVLLWLGFLRYRIGVRRLRRRMASLASEKGEIQAKLDREVTWRRAAEPAKEAS